MTGWSGTELATGDRDMHCKADIGPRKEDGISQGTGSHQLHGLDGAPEGKAHLDGTLGRNTSSSEKGGRRQVPHPEELKVEQREQLGSDNERSDS
jgi:hypothetical protein